MRREEERAKLKFILAMLLAGTVGLFVRMVPLASSQTAFARGLIGCVCVLLFCRLRKIRLCGETMKKDLPVLLLSGAALGLNWMLLFQAYRYTTIANATICYYFAPVLFTAASPFLFRERLRPFKVICLLASLAGLFLLTGAGGMGEKPAAGMLYGLCAAFFYAVVVCCNKLLRHVTDGERCVVQLGTAAAALLPYMLATEGLREFGRLTPVSGGILLFVCLVHTGLFYLVYFSSIRVLKAQTAALYSYLDPASAILLSAVFLREPLGLFQAAGGILILGAAAAGELSEGREKKEALK